MGESLSARTVTARDAAIGFINGQVKRLVANGQAQTIYHLTATDAGFTFHLSGDRKAVRAPQDPVDVQLTDKEPIDSTTPTRLTEKERVTARRILDSIPATLLQYQGRKIPTIKTVVDLFIVIQNMGDAGRALHEQLRADASDLEAVGRVFARFFPKDSK